MSNTKEVGQALAKSPEVKRGTTVKEMLERVDIKKRFTEMLGTKSGGFMSSIISLVSNDKNLATCDPTTVISAAAMAATLDLPINKNLGFAWVIPYKGRAEFQMGYKGFIQLAIRTGQYKTMNSSEIYSDEIKHWNPITGEIVFTDVSTWKLRYEGNQKNIVGYVAFFKLVNGFEKYLYMTTSQIAAHGKRYAQSFDNPKGKWVLDPHAMSLKTPLKLLLSKYGVLSIEMQRAIAADQGTIISDGGKEGVPEVQFDDAVVVEQVAEISKVETSAILDKEAGTAQEPE
jgi:recombination protein RecT